MTRPLVAAARFEFGSLQFARSKQVEKVWAKSSLSPITCYTICVYFILMVYHKPANRLFSFKWFSSNQTLSTLLYCDFTDLSYSCIWIGKLCRVIKLWLDLKHIPHWSHSMCALSHLYLNESDKSPIQIGSWLKPAVRFLTYRATATELKWQYAYHCNSQVTYLDTF